MAKRKLDWVGTTGGPHLLVPEAHACHWEGVAEPSHGRKVQATFRYDRAGVATDYDRACDMPGWAGAIRVGRGYGVVLTGDMTMAAQYMWAGRQFIIRWVYAPSESALLAHFRAVIDSLAAEEEAFFRHPGGRVVLLDAGDIPRSWLGDHAEFELPAGRYRVTSVYTAAKEVSFIAHELQRVGA